MYQPGWLTLIALVKYQLSLSLGASPQLPRLPGERSLSLSDPNQEVTVFDFQAGNHGKHFDAAHFFEDDSAVSMQDFVKQATCSQTFPGRESNPSAAASQCSSASQVGENVKFANLMENRMCTTPALLCDSLTK